MSEFGKETDRLILSNEQGEAGSAASENFSMQSIQEYLASLPLGCSIILTINVTVYVIATMFSGNILYLSPSVSFLNDASLSASDFINGGDYSSLITSPFAHVSIMHILFNMMTLVQLGPILETQFGTSQFLILSCWAVLFTGIIYMLLEYLEYLLTGNQAVLATACVGYSGVLFSYALIETYHSNVDVRSVFGLFSVPAKLYPWVLLVLLSLLMPGISFLGHLSGILFGLLVVSGIIASITPSIEYQKEMEQLSCCSILYNRSNYKKCTTLELYILDFWFSYDGPAGWLKPFLIACQQLYYLCEAVLVIVGVPTSSISAWVYGLYQPPNANQQRNFGGGVLGSSSSSTPPQAGDSNVGLIKDKNNDITSLPSAEMDV